VNCWFPQNSLLFGAEALVVQIRAPCLQQQKECEEAPNEQREYIYQFIQTQINLTSGKNAFSLLRDFVAIS